jgi:hypothetical protein
MKQTLSFLLLISFAISFGQNKIDKSKKALISSEGVKNQNTTTSSSSSSSSKSSSNSENNIIGEAVIDAFLFVSYGVFKYGFIGDYYNENHLYNSLSKYPFYNEKSGNYLSIKNDTLKNRFLRFDLEDSFIYSSNNLYGNHLKAKIRPFQYFYLQFDFHQMYEFDEIQNTNSQLSLFNFNFGYDRIRFEKFNLGWTLGASYVGNEVKKAGLSYGLNVEYFMGNHISFLVTGKWSKINTQPVNAFELKSKFHQKNYFFSLGYQHLKIATPTYNFISLGAGIYL